MSNTGTNADWITVCIATKRENLFLPLLTEPHIKSLNVVLHI
jgi:hypothetical protein